MDPKALQKKIRGVVHLVMTPFDEKDELDEKALRAGLRNALKNAKGKDFLILAGGSTAEFYAMNDEETRRYTEIVIDEVNGVCPVIVGTARAGTKYTVELSRMAEKAGADGVMIVNPYYVTATNENLYEHFKKIAESIQIGVMLYNNPITTKMWMQPDLVAKISKIDNVIASKDNISNPMSFFRMQKAVDPADMTVFTGLGYEMYQYLALSPLGCPAYVSELVNFVPKIAFEIYEAGERRDAVKMKTLIEALEPYRIFCDKLASRRKIPQIVGPLVAGPLVTIYQAVIKEVQTILGIPTGKVRGPVDNMSSEEIAELHTVVKQLLDAEEKV